MYHNITHNPLCVATWLTLSRSSLYKYTLPYRYWCEGGRSEGVTPLCRDPCPESQWYHVFSPARTRTICNKLVMRPCHSLSKRNMTLDRGTLSPIISESVFWRELYLTLRCRESSVDITMHSGHFIQWGQEPVHISDFTRTLNDISRIGSVTPWPENWPTHPPEGRSLLFGYSNMSHEDMALPKGIRQIDGIPAFYGSIANDGDSGKNYPYGRHILSD